MNEQPSIFPVDAPEKMPEGSCCEDDGTAGSAVKDNDLFSSVVLAVEVEDDRILCCWLLRLKTRDNFR